MGCLIDSVDDALEKTAFVTTILFEFCAIPFGPMNSPAVFQTVMKGIILPEGLCGGLYSEQLLVLYVFSHTFYLSQNVKHFKSILRLRSTK